MNQIDKEQEEQFIKEKEKSDKMKLEMIDRFKETMKSSNLS